MSDLHECPAPGCGRRVRFDHLMCPRHWYMVPAQLRSRVWRTWRDGDGYGSADHATAIREACEAVARLERRGQGTLL